MLGTSTTTGYLSTSTTHLLKLATARLPRIRWRAAAGVKLPTVSTPQAAMPKRKRTTTVKTKAVGALLTTKVKKHNIARTDKHEGEEDFEPELTPIEDSPRSNSELNGNNKSKKKTAATDKKVLNKSMPKGKPVASRKDRIKTEDENGDPIMRAPQVNSDYLPLPWEGRLGYVSLPS